MSNRSSGGDIDFNSSMRWGGSRIASALILILIVLGGVSYGIYSIIKPANSSAPSTKTNQTTNQPSKTTESNNSNRSTSTNAQSAQTSTPTELTNTGPGDGVLIAFISVAAFSTTLHYAWRKFSLLKQ